MSCREADSSAACRALGLPEIVRAGFGHLPLERVVEDVYADDSDEDLRRPFDSICATPAADSRAPLVASRVNRT